MEERRGVKDVENPISARTATRIAWSLCVLCLSLAIGSLVLGVLNGRGLQYIVFEEMVATIAVLTGTFSVVGAIIASHRPDNPIGWIFCAAALFEGITMFGDEYATYALITRPGSLLLGAEMSWLAEWIWAPGLGLILVFLPLLFPNGRPPSRRWHPVAWIGAISIGLICVLVSILAWPDRGTPLLIDPVRDEVGPTTVLDRVLEAGAFPLMLAAGVAAVISLLVRFRHAKGDEREQIKWFAFAAALAIVWVVVFEELVRTEGGLLDAIAAISSLLVTAAIPVATGIAIMKYRLYDIDVIIRRTLIYGSLTAVLAAIYFGSVVLSQALFRPLIGAGNDLAVVASTLAIAALFQPLRRRIQAFIDRRFYRRRYDAAKTLQAFSAQLRDEVDLSTLTDALLTVVEETLQPAHVSLWRREGGQRTRQP